MQSDPETQARLAAVLLGLDEGLHEDAAVGDDDALRRFVVGIGRDLDEGQAFGLHLAQEQADVVLGYRSGAEAAERVAETVRQLGRRAWLVQVDVAPGMALV